MTATPLNIVHYVPGIRLFQGGVVRAILDNCSVLSALGHQMTVIVYQPDDMPPTWMDGPNPRAVVVPDPYLPGRPLPRPALKNPKEFIAAADVLHLHAPGSTAIANSPKSPADTASPTSSPPMASSTIGPCNKAP